MSKINITFEIDTEDSRCENYGTALSHFLDIVYGTNAFLLSENTRIDIKYNTDSLPENTSITNTVEKKKETRGRKTDAEREKRIIKSENINVTDPSIKDIRFILTKKLGSNRNKIIEKLKSYGIENIKDMSKDNYVEFMEFLLSLK